MHKCDVTLRFLVCSTLLTSYVGHSANTLLPGDVFLAILISLENVKSVPPGGTVTLKRGVRAGAMFSFVCFPCFLCCGVELLMFGGPKLSPSAFKRRILFKNIVCLIC